MTDSIVAARSLTKRFDGRTVLNDINVTAGPGEVIGILGKNGAGKTTLLELLLGFGPPSAGHAELFGADSMQLTDTNKARIGYVPQRDELVEFVTGRQQLDLISTFRNNWDAALVDRLVTEWEIPLSTRIGKMSVGERQKLSVVQTLAHHPELLILDEPVAALDPIARRRFLRQLLDIAEMTHRSVLFSSHIISDLERAAQTVWILKDGQMTWQGDLDRLKERVVRVHVYRERELTAPALPGLLSSRVDGKYGVLTIADFDSTQEASLRETFGGDVRIESLGLEDIFVELHG